MRRAGVFLMRVSIRQVGIKKAVVREASIGRLGVVLVRAGIAGVVSSEIRKRSQPAQIFLAGLRWTSVLWSLLSRRSQLEIIFSLQIC